MFNGRHLLLFWKPSPPPLALPLTPGRFQQAVAARKTQVMIRTTCWLQNCRCRRRRRWCIPWAGDSPAPVCLLPSPSSSPALSRLHILSSSCGNHATQALPLISLLNMGSCGWACWSLGCCCCCRSCSAYFISLPDLLCAAGEEYRRLLLVCIFVA